MKKSISIIIPTYNEEKNITKLIPYLQKAQKGHLLEILISDGGSTDATVAVAEHVGATVIQNSKKSRAVQMNSAADAASGEILFFLHADTLPPDGYDQKIITALAAQRRWGCFKLKFDYSHWFLTLITWFTRFDVSYIRFGDQGLFLKKDTFYSIGQFNPEFVIFEDTDISLRLSKLSKPAIQNDPAITSARKFVHNGVYKLTIVFFYIWILYLLNFSHDMLLKTYRRLIDQDKI